MDKVPPHLPPEAIKEEAEERLGVGKGSDQLRARGNYIAYLGVFVIALSVVISVNTWSGGLTSYAGYAIPLGVLLGCGMIILGRTWTRKLRTR